MKDDKLSQTGQILSHIGSFIQIFSRDCLFILQQRNYGGVGGTGGEGGITWLPNRSSFRPTRSANMLHGIINVSKNVSIKGVSNKIVL